MDKNIKAVFDDVCSNLVIDQALANKIEKWRLAWTLKNTDHAEFFGGNLTGVHVVRFLDSDREDFFRTIFQVDEVLLADRCHELIDPAFYQIASDTLNLGLVWLCHRFHQNTKMSAKQKADVCTSLFQVMQYKFITSRMFRHWKYPATREVAEATLDRMSNKFSLKAKGNWNNVLRDRAADITDIRNGTFKNVILKMEVDVSPSSNKTVAGLINHTQNGIRSMLKNIFGLSEEVRLAGVRISTTTGTINLDGEETLKDKNRSMQMYKRYLISILPDKRSFIKDDLVDIIIRATPNMNDRSFVQTLEWMSDNYNQSNRVNLEATIDKIMTHVIGYLSENRSVMRNQNDIVGLLTHMKGIYTASKASDPTVLEIRKEVEKLVKHASGLTREAQIAATRTGILLYLLLRSFTMKHYS